MKIKIVNKKKFMKLPIIILISLFVLICLFTNKTSSTTETTYKSIYVLQGDTLWDIASDELKTNQYYKGFDIRDVVQNIQECNSLSNASLVIGKELKIPTF